MELKKRSKINKKAGQIILANMKLRYFVVRKRSKTGTDYYWQCTQNTSEKYGVGKFIALGKSEKQALIKWQELNDKLNNNKKYLREYGVLPENTNNITDGSFKHISELYLKDRRFIRLAERTKKTYIYTINRINNQLLYDGQKKPLATLPITQFNRVMCKALYEKLLNNGKLRIAEYIIKVIANILQTAIDYGYLHGDNPCSKMTIEKNKPRDQVWTKEEFYTLIDNAKVYTGLYIAVNIAYYTAQRQTDILNLKWSQIDPEFKYITIKQSKTQARVIIPLHIIKPLRELLQSTSKVSDYVVVDHTDDKPYHNRVSLFADRFDTIRKKSQINQELVFRDLRRTAILALDEAGCTSAEIASISGHSRNSIIQMLEIYAPKSKNKAESAIEKMNKFDDNNKFKVV